MSIYFSLKNEHNFPVKDAFKKWQIVIPHLLRPCPDGCIYLYNSYQILDDQFISHRSSTERVVEKIKLIKLSCRRLNNKKLWILNFFFLFFFLLTCFEGFQNWFLCMMPINFRSFNNSKPLVTKKIPRNNNILLTVQLLRKYFYIRKIAKFE